MKGTTFMDKCKGIALIMGAFSLMLFGAAALIHSASPAQADNSGPQMVNSTGKYQMSISSSYNTKHIFWYILVWDTETGRSKFYYGDAKGGTMAAHSGYQIPSRPL